MHPNHYSSMHGRSLSQVILSITGVIAFVAAFIGVRLLLIHVFEPSNATVVRQSVEQAKKQIKIPSKVDANTTITSITPQGESIHYTYTLNGLDPARVNEEVIRAIVKPGVCKDAQIATLFKRGITLKYDYTVSETGDKYDFTLGREDCK